MREMPNFSASGFRFRVMAVLATAAVSFFNASQTMAQKGIGSDQLLDLGSPTSDGLSLEGDQALRTGDTKTAIKDLEKALQMDPKNIQARSRYAEALEQKLRKQKHPDPKLYNFVIKQWVHVCKDSMYDDSDEKQRGHNHLEALCGKAPKIYEPSKHFLDKNLLPEDGSVKVSFTDEKQPQ
jgi:tetratricopeptide (TPR) repeat protein